jgi:hypothetical protein
MNSPILPSAVHQPRLALTPIVIAVSFISVQRQSAALTICEAVKAANDETDAYPGKLPAGILEYQRIVEGIPVRVELLRLRIGFSGFSITYQSGEMKRAMPGA